MKKYFFILLALLILGGFAAGRVRGPFTSVEVRFTDASVHGMEIVPASCPSTPDFTGQCNAPTCTITLSPTTIAYGTSSKLTYASTYGTSFYITNIGNVSTSGASTFVSPTITTSYTGTVVNSAVPATTTCSAALTVTAPSAPTTTIVASSTSIYVGQSTGIKATFTAANHDPLTHDNIDSPVGNGLAANTNPDAIKWYTFTPSSAGTYTFYARAQTSYYPSWTTYNSVAVTVLSAPACTISLSPASIAQGSSATLSYSSSNATAFSINNVGSVVQNVSGSTSVSPSISTDYTGTVSAGGITNMCTAPGTSPAGTLSVSCTPAYTCAANAIRYTNASCAVSTVSTCATPSFCSTGSSVCLYPPPSFTISSGGITGHLQASPLVVPQGNPSKVYWDVANVSSCSVAGTNGDHWNTTSSGTGGKTTSGIQQQTTFTLSCTGLDSSSFNESVSINVVPVFIER